MKKEYDFSKAKRDVVLPSEGKTRIAIYPDDIVIERFKAFRKDGKGVSDLAE